MNFKNITSIKYRVASAGAGGRIALHQDSPTGRAGRHQSYRRRDRRLAKPGSTSRCPSPTPAARTVLLLVRKESRRFAALQPELHRLHRHRRQATSWQGRPIIRLPSWAAHHHKHGLPTQAIRIRNGSRFYREIGSIGSRARGRERIFCFGGPKQKNISSEASRERRSLPAAARTPNSRSHGSRSPESPVKSRIETALRPAL